jgi:hypothetical protein
VIGVARRCECRQTAAFGVARPRGLELRTGGVRSGTAVRLSLRSAATPLRGRAASTRHRARTSTRSTRPGDRTVARGRKAARSSPVLRTRSPVVDLGVRVSPCARLTSPDYPARFRSSLTSVTSGRRIPARAPDSYRAQYLVGGGGLPSPQPSGSHRAKGPIDAPQSNVSGGRNPGKVALPARARLGDICIRRKRSARHYVPKRICPHSPPVLSAGKNARPA